MNLCNGEETSTTTKESRVASFSELLLYVSKITQIHVNRRSGCTHNKYKKKAPLTHNTSECFLPLHPEVVSAVHILCSSPAP